MQKHGFEHMQTAKAQISLCIRAVWSGPSLSAIRTINTIECIDGEQMHEWDFVHARD